MKKSFILTVVLLGLYLGAYAQYQLGHTIITFVDVTRNRNIETEIYYPADAQGEDVAISAGTFPYIVLGHGFSMGTDAYMTYADSLVPEGYILLLPATETGLSPNHQKFGLDLKFLAANFINENTVSTSIFYNAVDNNCAIMGHSMGGGSSFLAAQNNTQIKTLVNFAAAETNPSAITAAASVTVPSLIFAGEEDGVAPPADNQTPMYDSLASDCKTYITILGGGHCKFADSNTACSFGETFAGGSGSISREEQHAVIFDFLKLWLAYYLKNQVNEMNVFNDSLAVSNRITYQQDCNVTFLNDINTDEISISPNPASSFIEISNCDFNISEIQILDIFGRKIKHFNNQNRRIMIDDFSNGIYFLEIESDNVIIIKKFIKN